MAERAQLVWLLLGVGESDTDALMEYLQQRFDIGPLPLRDSNPMLELTRREEEILRWRLQGRSVREIADSLYVTPGTVKRHLSNIRSKKRRLDAHQHGTRMEEDEAVPVA